MRKLMTRREIPVMRLTSSAYGSQATIELLLKSMYLTKYLRTRWGLNIGAPEVADFGRVIYKLDFSNKINITKK